MTILLFVLCVAVTLGIAAWLARPDSPARTLRLRAAAGVDALAGRIGGIAAALVIVVGGLAVVLTLTYPLGLLAHALENAVDWPVFHYYQARLRPGWFDHANNIATLMGNRPQIKAVCVGAGVILALVWRTQRWVPPVVIAATFVVEKYGQKFLAVTVDRGHPPTTLGTYPSGGCARLISIYGVVLFLTVIAVPHLSRRAKAIVWTGLALALAVEAYSRTYLLKHWITDAVGGIVYGYLLLAVMIAATWALLRGVGWQQPTDDDVPAVRSPRHVRTNQSENVRA